METKTYTELQAEIAELERQAKQARAAELAEVIASIRAQMAEHGITKADLQATKPRGKVPPKYRDEQGNAWTGRGKMPMWMLEDLHRRLTLYAAVQTIEDIGMSGNSRSSQQAAFRSNPARLFHGTSPQDMTPSTGGRKEKVRRLTR